MTAPPLLRFQTEKLCRWINQKYAVPDDQKNSIYGLQTSFRSGGMSYLTLINKEMGFSQSLLRVPAGGDIIWQKPNITRVVIY